MINLVSSTPRTVIRQVGEANYLKHFGMLVTPGTGYTPARSKEIGGLWAIDNGAFKDFDAKGFRSLLRRNQVYASDCLWVVAPDVVGNHIGTLTSFWQWKDEIKSYGYKVALAIQNGATTAQIPYEHIDAAFIGGDTKFKLSSVAAEIVRDAKVNGKWVHMGRVSSVYRIQYARVIGCDSFDSSSYAAFPYRCKEHLPLLQHVQLALGDLLCG